MSTFSEFCYTWLKVIILLPTAISKKSRKSLNKFLQWQQN